jgi:hypothetical protein
MRKLFILILLFTSTLRLFSQEISKTNDGYTEIVQVELPKKEIYQKLNEWIALNYKSANAVIQLNT